MPTPAIDLTKYKKIRKVFTFGENSKFKIAAECPVTSFEENGFTIGNLASKEERKRVHDYEPVANKQQGLF